MKNFTEIIIQAWKAYDASRTIKNVEDISALVSTNHVYRITFDDGDFIIAKLSSFGQYEHFKEDHRIIHSLANNLLYPFENLLAKSLLKNNRVFTYRYKKDKTDAWVVFYNPSRVMQRLPKRLDEPSIKSLGRQIGKFHLACSRVRNVLPKSSKTLRTDINILLERIENEPDRYGKKSENIIIKHHCDQFLKNRLKCNANTFETIPVFIDWNIGNFSVINNNELYSRWDYDWFRMSSRMMDFYFFSRVVSDSGDKTVFSYLINPMNEPRFLLFLQEYHKINPISADEIRFLREVYRFFILKYVVSDGSYFFSNQYSQKLLHESFEIYLPSIDRDFDPEKIIDFLKIKDK